MMKVKGYKVVEVTDTNINFDVCEELYEMSTGMDLIGRVINNSIVPVLRSSAQSLIVIAGIKKR